MKRLDELDRKILKMLSENARLSFRKIAKELNTTPMTVLRRVKALEKAEVIKGYKAIINYEALGYSYPICLYVRVKSGYNPLEVGEKLAQMENVLMIFNTTGQYDLSLIVYCKDKEGALDIVNKLSSIEGIERVDIHAILRKIKFF